MHSGEEWRYGAGNSWSTLRNLKNSLHPVHKLFTEQLWYCVDLSNKNNLKMWITSAAKLYDHVQVHVEQLLYLKARVIVARRQYPRFN